MFGQRMREIRLEKKLSISELSRRTKITKSYLSNIERNICTNPTIDIVQKIANGFGVHPAALLKWKENRKELQQSANNYSNDIKNTINTMNDEQLIELKGYVEIIEWKRKKLPINDLVKFI
ncbi:helix-turn-helix transcriptional regulator [Priestia sp. SB1]|uniref:helix-turn-helix domain-containing protein n=1 Tax=Priestia sp. SB1 TaxID=3132359 RepID=UPI00317B00ED